MKIIRKITDPLFKQLKQGATPEKLAQSIAFGIVLGTFPLLGTTTSLCLLAASIFKLNHIAIQTMNYVAYPIQILLLIPYFRMGEWIFSREPIALDIKMITQEFNDNFLLALEKYLKTGLMGAFAWLLIAPIAWVALYYVSRLLIKRVKIIKEI